MTAELLAEREMKLSVVQDAAAKREKMEVDRLNGLHDAAIGERRLLDAVTADLAAITSQVATSADTLAEIQDQMRQGKEELDQQASYLQSAQAAVHSASEQISPLHQTKLSLEDEIGELKREKTRIDGEKGEKIAEYDLKIVEAERTLASLRAKSQDVALKIDEDEKSWEQVREDLARREAKLNARDEVVTRRELKVSRSEQDMTRNANMMNL